MIELRSYQAAKMINIKAKDLRNKALIRNEQFYFTNIPCPKGHIAKRYTRNHGCTECYKLWNKKGSIKRKENQYKYDIKKLYNITYDEYSNMLKMQNGVCAICEQKESINKNLSVDHCHETGKIRGLLCLKCNQGIGLLKHNVKWLRKAALYCEAAA